MKRFTWIFLISGIVISLVFISLGIYFQQTNQFAYQIYDVPVKIVGG